eukprot:scaffold31594_cov56-Phaeocystis_antarctica.AAC.1
MTGRKVPIDTAIANNSFRLMCMPARSTSVHCPSRYSTRPSCSAHAPKPNPPDASLYATPTPGAPAIGNAPREASGTPSCPLLRSSAAHRSSARRTFSLTPTFPHFRRKLALATRNMQCSHYRPCGKQHAANSS